MCTIDDLDCWTEQFLSLVGLRSDLDSLHLSFVISIIIVSIVLFLSVVLLIILYSWMYALEKKMQKLTGTSTVDFRIRRAQIREFPSPTTSTSPKPLVNGQNPLSRSPNFTAVVDDLNKRSTTQSNSQQPRYPNYISDNNNFIY